MSAVTPSPVVGANYLQAVYSNDTDMISALRMAFTADELLDAITVGVNSPAMILGRRAQYAEGFATLTEYGDTLVAAAVLMQRATDPGWATHQ